MMIADSRMINLTPALKESMRNERTSVVAAEKITNLHSSVRKPLENPLAAQPRADSDTNRPDNTRQKELMNERLQDLNQQLALHPAFISRDIELDVDQEHDQVIYRIVNRDTQEVIREIPSKEVLKMMDNLENLRGMLFEDEV